MTQREVIDALLEANAKFMLEINAMRGLIESQRKEGIENRKSLRKLEDQVAREKKKAQKLQIKLEAGVLALPAYRPSAPFEISTHRVQLERLRSLAESHRQFIDLQAKESNMSTENVTKALLAFLEVRISPISDFSVALLFSFFCLLLYILFKSDIKILF